MAAPLATLTGMNALEMDSEARIVEVVLSRPQVEPCVPAFPRKCGNWKTQAHTGRLFVDYAALSNNRCVSDQLGTFGRRCIHVHVTGDKTQE